MRKLFIPLLSLVLMAVLTSCASGASVADQAAPTPVPAESIPVTTLSPTITNTTLSGGVLSTRTYDLTNNDQISFGSLSNSAETIVARLPYTGGTLRIYHPTNGWTTLKDPASGDYRGTLFILDSTGRSVLAYPPQRWKALQNHSRQFLSYGFLRISGNELQLIAPATNGTTTADYTLAVSSAPLIDWSHPNSESLWSGYTNSGSGRWCYDGYYWPAPSTYVPSGNNVYYRMVDAYLCRSFLYAASVHRAAEDLVLCMLDVMADQQNSFGFFPTLPGSTWLSGDYGIGNGFYDTRFNTDLIEMFRKGWETYHIERFQLVLNRYFTFYQTYAETHHRATKHNGWLIDDYYNPTGGRRTHTSLNHQLAEILLLYQASDTLAAPALADLADQLLLAIEDTARHWIRSDHNLHYGIYADGSYGGIDYPYLTYNDLFALQCELEARGHGRSAVLDQLMASKKVWMDATGVTDYRKK